MGRSNERFKRLRALVPWLTAGAGSVKAEDEGILQRRDSRQATTAAARFDARGSPIRNDQRFVT